MKIRLFLPEDQIIRQGDPGECLYFVARGECDVFVVDENQLTKYTATLRGCSYFGEIALLK